MKLLVPVSSLESAEKQIKAGADEIYLGGETKAFSNLSFSGRGKYNPSMTKICLDSGELREIVQCAHENKVSVMYTANIPFLADDPDGTQVYEKSFLDYVEEGINAGVDSIVLADIGAILLLKEEGIKTHITASTFFETVNKNQIYFLKELGVNRVVLSYQVTMEEIEAMTEVENMELEVFGHYGCSFYDGYCNLKHFFGETSKSGIGVPCQNCYKLVKGDEVISESHFLRFSLVCSVCSLLKLKSMGIYALKLVGRARNEDHNAEITSIYAEILRRISDMDYACNDQDVYIQQLRNELLPRWWMQSICKQGLCKYKENAVTRTFVGAEYSKKGEI